VPFFLGGASLDGSILGLRGSVGGSMDECVNMTGPLLGQVQVGKPREESHSKG
jgi:hypothetical protein